MSATKPQWWQERRSDKGPPPKRPRRDSGPPPPHHDGGPPPPREVRGPHSRDSGPPPRDNGPPPRDSGPPSRDSGPPSRDSGPPPRDNGPPPRDNGPPHPRRDFQRGPPRHKDPRLGPPPRPGSPGRRPPSPRRRYTDPPPYDPPPPPGGSRFPRAPSPPGRGPRGQSPPRKRSPGRPRNRSPPGRPRSPPRRLPSPPPPYPRDGPPPGRRQAPPPYPEPTRPPPPQDPLEERRRELKAKEQQIKERERLLKEMVQEQERLEKQIARPSPREVYREERLPPGRLPDPEPITIHEPPPYRHPESRDDRRPTPIRPVRQAPSAVLPPPPPPVVDVAKALELQLESLHKRNDTLAMLEAFDTSKIAGVQPTAQSYIYLLSALSLAEDAINMETIYVELFFQQKLPLKAEQCHEAIFILSQSPLKSRVMELYMQLRRTGHLIQNPLTYRILISCCTDGAGAMAIFEDMKKSEMLISVPTYHSLLTLVSGQPHSVRTILQDMIAHSVNPSDVLVQMKAPDALAMAQAIVQSGASVEEPLFLQLLQKVGSTDIQGLLAMWRKAPGLMTLPCASGLVGLAVQHGQLGTALIVWEEVCKHRIPGDGVLAITLIEALAAAKDTRVFAVYNEAKNRLEPSLTVFNYILAVAAHHRIVHVAKEMWRDMQANDVLPDDEALSLILQAASRDQRASMELFDVIRASQLAIPIAAAKILFEAFNRTEDGRSRIPDLRRACPELNTAHPVSANQGSAATNSVPPPRPGPSRMHRPGTYD